MKHLILISALFGSTFSTAFADAYQDRSQARVESIIQQAQRNIETSHIKHMRISHSGMIRFAQRHGGLAGAPEIVGNENYQEYRFQTNDGLACAASSCGGSKEVPRISCLDSNLRSTTTLPKECR